jgi:flagellar biosynthesis/type III secretory pathway protein FliH
MEPTKNISKHRPPSRIKYEKNNPVFSVRIPEAWNDTIEKFRQETGLSKKKVFGLMLEKIIGKYEAVKKQGYDEGYKKGVDEGKKMGYDEAYNKGKQDEFTKGYNKGYNEGYKVGKDEYLIEVPCARCNKPLILTRYTQEYPTFKKWAQVCLFHRYCP